MLQFLLTLLAPGATFGPDSSLAVSSEGLSFGWAFFLFVACVIAVAWSYRRYATTLSPALRFALIVLRCVLFALAIVLLVRPVLVVSIKNTVRRPLWVLLDLSQSMTLADRRAQLDDVTRAALAKGVISPDGGLSQSLAGLSVEDLRQIPRSKLLELLAANPQLNFWPDLQAKSDLIFYGFGRKLSELGKLEPATEGLKLTTDESARFFQQRVYDENLTAIGDALIDLLNQQRGQPSAGVLLITDGGNNSGTSPLVAANVARDDHVPLFIYGVGITHPQDAVVTDLNGPATSSLKERVNFTVHLRAQGLAGRKTTVELQADGKVVDTEPVAYGADGEQDVTVGYEPQEVGDVRLEATVKPLPEEAVQDNNTAVAQHRVVDDKINVLVIEDEPRWDYIFLTEMLLRDRRIKAKILLVQADGSIDPSQPDSPYIDAFPEDPAALNKFDVVFLGDVDPNFLGSANLKMLSDWVSKSGGGLVFQAGTRFNPAAYADTPLEPLVPVELSPGTTPASYPEPVPLNLTVAGAASSLLSLVQNPEDNETIWDKFPGVRWTALVGKARPGADVLLTDPTAERATSDGPMPVMATQGYGLGETLFLGEQETYRWRAHEGEKYYTQIFGQIIQALAAQHLLGGAGLTQLSTDRLHYLTGERVRISGHLFRPGREALTDPDVVGQLKSADAKGGAPVEVRLEAVPDRPGFYQGETTVQKPGTYHYFTLRDPSVAATFDVAEPKVELADIAMKEKLLRSMAQTAEGHFLREEDLHLLPKMITAQSASNISVKKVPLSCAPLLFAFMLLVACAEWLWRRRLRLK